MLESPASLPVPPVKFKRRKVSAIRDFPAGCGPTELPPALDAPVEAFKGLGRVEDGRDSLKLAKSPAKGIDGGVVKVIEGRRSLEVEKGEEVVVKSLVKGIDRVVVEKLDPLKKYPPPRRRKVSVTRDFPVGCGSIDLPVNGVVSGDGIVDSKSMALFVEKNSVEKEMPVVEGLDKVELNGRVEGEAERRDVTGSQWRDVLEIGVAAAAAASIRESLDAKEKAVEECGPISNGLKQMEIAKNVEDEAVEAGSNSKQPQPRDEKTGKMETLDGVKKLVMKQKVMEEEGLDQVASVVKLGGEVRNEIKEIQVRVPENSGTPQDMPPTQNSGLNESVVESEQKQKIIVNSVSKKKIEVHEMRQVIERPNSMEARESKLFSPDATSPSGSRVVDGDARSLVVWSPKSREEQESKSARSDATTTSGSKVADRDAWSLVVRSPKSRESQESKPPCSDATSPSVSTREIYKGSFRIQKSRKNLGKRSYEELEDEGFGINAQADSALVASGGDRLIIQALMSAQNCPWRQDSKKSLKSGARSVTPINKMKKEGNQACKTRMGVSHSHDKSIVVIQDDKDPLVWEAETPKPVVAYRKPHEIDVSLAPLGPSVSNLGGGDSDGVPRNRVKRALRLFQVISRKLLQEEEAKKQVVGRIRRIDLAAANILKDKNEWVYKGQAFVGVVPGVEVGDEFHYRVELSIVGLHRPFQGGIDSTKVNGMPVATSIVASGGYPDDMDNSDVLIYSGSGGNPQGGDKQPGDQKLERGNLALKNSIEAKAPVRVIHGFKENKGSESHDSKTKVISTFTYDGLYLVEDYWQERGPHGFYVFKFRLRRVPGQPDIGLKQVKKSKHLKVREGLCIKDISEGKEIIPICVVNTIDNDRPAPFVYTPQIIYPSWYVPTPPAGCNCANGCSDSNKCACAVKNGGEIPFNFNGNIIQAKPLVYECGPSCKCPPTCYNRVSQHGVKVQLEIFKTTTRGWGVRSLYSIPSGSFICEYTGELLRDTEAEQKHNDEYLFDIGHNYDDQSLWEGLPSLVPPLHSNPLGENKEDVGFTIDAAEYGNVGRFINHSCSPNLYAQNVLYDHDDRRIPHIMLFAADNIPPLQELTYHYNYTIDHVRDSEGNIKQKDCYCGAPDCTGRLY